jgi:VanZ family protein
MGTLAFVLNLLFYKNNSKNLSLANLAGFFIAISLSTIEEFSQIFLIYRSFSYADLAANYFGIISFTLLYFLLINKSNYFKFKYLQS